jgi:hypothetical protein
LGGAPIRLWHNVDGQHFVETSDHIQPTMGTVAVSLAIGDYDHDGYPDLFNPGSSPAGGSQLARLYHNERDGTFREVVGALGSGLTLPYSGAWGDFDNDLDLDLFVASDWSGGSRNNLYRNRGDGTFEEVTSGPIVNDPGYSLGAVWADFDNDGFLDLFVANAKSVGDAVYGYNNYLYQGQTDGTLRKLTRGNVVTDGGVSVGASWTDYNDDGFLDLFVVNFEQGAQDYLYRGNPNGNAWLKVKLVGQASNRDGVGARVEAQARYAGAERWQLREIQGGDGFAHSAPLLAHFGLGDATNITTLRIEWPSGIVQELHDVAVRQTLTLTEPTPGLVEPVRRADGKFQFILAGERGKTYRIESKAELSPLVSWTALRTVSVTTNTRVTVEVPVAPGAPAQFYRAVEE